MAKGNTGNLIFPQRPSATEDQCQCRRADEKEQQPDYKTDQPAVKDYLIQFDSSINSDLLRLIPYLNVKICYTTGRQRRGINRFLRNNVA